MAIDKFASWTIDKALNALDEYLEKNNNDISLVKRKARNGDMEAVYNMGLMYYSGNREKRNYYEALQCFLQSGEHGIAMAQFYAASMYYDGKGVKQNYSKALEWFTKAAEQDIEEAQYQLGYMYYYKCSYSTAQ